MLPTERTPLPEQNMYRTQPFGTPALKPVAHMERILVVEDDRAVQKALKRLFEAEGLLVEVCGDGKLAVDVFNSFRPSAVILDFRLPGMSGRDICHEIKQHSPLTPVLVLSAASDVADKVLLLEIGADDYVTKPFSPRELLARVRTALRRTSRAGKHGSHGIRQGQRQLQEDGSVTRWRSGNAHRPGIQDLEIPYAEFRTRHYA